MTARRVEVALILAVVLGVGAVVQLSRWIEPRRPAGLALEDDDLYLSGDVARRLSLAFNGLAADWYWLRTLQYIGKKIQEQAGAGAANAGGEVELDRIRGIRPKVLADLFDITTTLDPRFATVYEFAAVILPEVDVQAAIRLVEKGIREMPTYPYLYQQLAYIHWQRGDYDRAAAVFRRGAEMTPATWMETMAARMEEKGSGRPVAREMYARMYAEATDDKIRTWALRRLMELRALDERDVLQGLLKAHEAREGRCPSGWREVAAELRRAPDLRLDAQGVPLDPSDRPYVMVAGRCEVALHPESRVPRH
jgi:tetratricopeptide (TPR) repeat protein